MDRNYRIFLMIEMYNLTTNIIYVFIDIGQLRLVHVGTSDPWIFVKRKVISSSETNSLLGTSL